MNGWKLNLSLFGEGEGGPAPVANGQEAKASEVIYGKQDAEPVAEVEKETKPSKPAFKDLIEGDYKEDFTNFFQEKFNERHKDHKSLEAKVTNYEGILQLVGQKYGISEVDADKILKAIEDDESYYENEAMEKGMTTEQLKDYKRLEREKSVLMKEKAERDKLDKATKIQQQWESEEAQLKTVYPDFNFRKEILDPKFVGLVTNNIDLRTAYEVVHRAELLDGAIRQTAQTVQKAVTQNIKAKGNRPTEEGMSYAQPATLKDNPRDWTEEDFRTVRKLVAQGKKIKL